HGMHLAIAWCNQGAHEPKANGSRLAHAKALVQILDRNEWTHEHLHLRFALPGACACAQPPATSPDDCPSSGTCLLGFGGMRRWARGSVRATFNVACDRDWMRQQRGGAPRDSGSKVAGGVQDLWRD